MCVVPGERLPTEIAGHGMNLPFLGQFSEGGDPLADEFFFFEQERIKGRIADDQGEDLTVHQPCTGNSRKIVHGPYSPDSKYPLRRPRILLSPLRELGMVVGTASWARGRQRGKQSRSR
jgi:hypothetical protein